MITITKEKKEVKGNISDELKKTITKIHSKKAEDDRPGFVMIPRPLIENKNLLSSELRVLLFLKGFCIKNKTCWPGEKLMAECLGMKIRQTRNILKSLNHKGFIEIKRAGRYNEYRPLQ